LPITALKYVMTSILPKDEGEGKNEVVCMPSKKAYEVVAVGA